MFKAEEDRRQLDKSENIESPQFGEKLDSEPWNR